MYIYVPLCVYEEFFDEIFTELSRTMSSSIL
jgi:hypothetical protein